MNTHQLGGIVVGAIIGVFGLLKIELIKEMVKKITSDKENVSLYSYVVLIILALVPAIVGFNIPGQETKTRETGQEQLNASSPKSDAEVISDGVKSGIILANEIAEKVQEQNEARKKEYEANKGDRWVYQIGDWIDIKNKESLLETNRKLSGIDNVCLFRNGSNAFYFINELHNKDELESSINEFKSRLDDEMIVKVVNLVDYCSYQHPELVEKKPLRIGKRKDHIDVKCCSCD
jgi:hypothetical protein